MFKIYEKPESLIHFLKPAIFVSLFFTTLVNIIAILIIFPYYLFNVFGEDAIVYNLLLLNSVDLIVIIILYIIIIPRISVNNVDSYPLNKTNFIKTLLILSATISLLFLINLIFQILVIIFDIKISSSYNSILITVNHINDPIAIFLFFSFGIFIGPLSEEIIYRRITIPYLENRGMSAFYAILGSSVVFSLAHAPNDMLSTNLSSTLIHLTLVFIIGFACGLTYVITRNILYPIIIHGLSNASSFIPYFLNLDSSKNQQLIENFQLIQGLTIIVGLIVLFYGFLKYTEIPTYSKWVKMLKQDSKNDIYKGLLGFLVISTTLIFLTTSFFMYSNDLETFFKDKITLTFIKFIIYLILLIFILYFLKNTEYVSNEEIIFKEDLNDVFLTKKIPNEDKDTVIEVKDLCKYYGEVKAVDKLSFKVKGGEIYGLLGPNGSGKSTTMRSILGLHVVNSGEISVLGYNPIISPESVKACVGYVAEDPTLYESMTVEDLLNFVVTLRKLDQVEANRIANKYLEALDAKKYYKKVIGTLSRGNKQKIQIICALLHQPKILIVDEPLSGLDARSGLILKEIFQILTEQGGSIILSTHIMEQAQILCNRIGIINKGKLVAEGTYDELRLKAKSSSGSLEDIFLQLTEQDVSANGLIQSLRA
ncbi:MAG: ATP-binding cassette domain-containing protein [Candidatus Thorarchaeota archaeon]